jgi:hypothetical protein
MNSSQEFQKNHDDILANIDRLRAIFSAERGISKRPEQINLRIAQIEEFMIKTIETLNLLARQDVNLNNALCE